MKYQSTIFILVSSLLITDVSYSTDLVIAHVTLWDGTGKPSIENAWVQVQGTQIARIGTGAPPASSNIINGSEQFLIPGLIDSHVHLGGGRMRAESSSVQSDLSMRRRAVIQDLHGYLYSGVTSVYDSGNLTKFIFPLRDAERAGEIMSPRIFATGGVVAFPGGYGSGPGATLVGSSDDFTMLNEHLDYEPDMVKFLLDTQGRLGQPVTRTFSFELLKQAIAQVHARNIRTTVHIPTEKEARMAIEAGADALAHPPARAMVSDAFAKYAQERSIPISTTLAVFGNIARVAETPEMFDTSLYRATLSKEERKRLKTIERERYISSGMSSFFSRMLPAVMENVRNLHKDGAILALGTDRALGPAVHQEFGLLTESGISPNEVLKMATLNAASYLGKEDSLGSIEVGKLADMILLSKDPTIDIANAQSVTAVFKGGKKINLNTLDIPINRRN